MSDELLEGIPPEGSDALLAEELKKVEPELPPKRPDITPAQMVGMIPLLAQFGHAFGLYTLSQPQQDSLNKLLLGGIALFGADALIRIGRNIGKRIS